MAGWAKSWLEHWTFRQMPSFLFCAFWPMHKAFSSAPSEALWFWRRCIARGFSSSINWFSCFIEFSSLSRSFAKEKSPRLLCRMQFAFLPTSSELCSKVQSCNTGSLLTAPSSTRHTHGRGKALSGITCAYFTRGGNSELLRVDARACFSFFILFILFLFFIYLFLFCP